MKRNLGFLGPADKPPAALTGIVSCGSIGEFRALAPLPLHAQELVDNAIIRVGRQRLAVVDTLIEAGLTVPLTNWLAVPTLTSHRIGESGYAQRTMIPNARGERQVADLEPYTIPIYCTWDDFSFNVRELMAADRAGYPLDTTHAEQATRNVNEAIEDAAINGGPQVDGNASPGLLNEPNVNTFSYTGNEAWDAAGHTGEEIIADVLTGADTLDADQYTGPFALLVPTTYGAKLNEDYKANSGLTILQRLKELEFGGQKLIVKVADKLPANRTVLMQLTSDVADVVVGQTPTNVSWEVPPGWERKFVVLACVIPRIKSNHSNGSGIAIGNTT